MSTKSNANLKAVELNQSELDSVIGGNSGMAKAAGQMQASQVNNNKMTSQIAQMQAQASMHNAISSMNKSIGSSIKSIGR
jgi:hypothetical protein